MNKPSIYKPISERDYVFQSGNIIMNKKIVIGKSSLRMI